MHLSIPKDITVLMDAYTVKFSSPDEDSLVQFAVRYAHGKGMRGIGAVRSTRCNITPEPSNQEHNLGVPSAHMMILVSHQDLKYAGDREPQTTTVYRTLCFQEDHHGDPHQYYEYHFTAELK